MDNISPSFPCILNFSDHDTDLIFQILGLKCGLQDSHIFQEEIKFRVNLRRTEELYDIKREGLLVISERLEIMKNVYFYGKVDGERRIKINNLTMTKRNIEQELLRSRARGDHSEEEMWSEERILQERAWLDRAREALERERAERQRGREGTMDSGIGI